MIYFIQDSFSKTVKIGCSHNPIERMNSLQTGFPYRLDLIGTTEGGPKEEALLHGQFRHFHLRGEWFRGDDELLKMIRKLIFIDGKPYTVWQECRRRGGCRSKLRGVEIGVIGWSEPYRIWYSRWSRDERLILSIYPLDGEAPTHRWATVELEEANKGRLTICLSDMASNRYRLIEPLGFERDIDADRCVLLSEWPIVCCEPDQRIEDWDK